MGWEYLIFRVWYEFKKKTGVLKKQFPTKINFHNFISLSEWKANPTVFFFESKEQLYFNKDSNTELAEEYQKYLDGELKYFNSKYYKIGRDYDWLTNPVSNYKYDINKHWTEIKDLDEKAGDIKYVWEKSRFSFLYLLIRYDYHFEVDNSKLVFAEILSWIKSNPINMGPNYICSQEISLRILNWTFALYYYKNSQNLTEDIFRIIINSIYGQLKHVYGNINFSRKSVRNNHAITETLTLYLGGLFFPFFPEAKLWKYKGKHWFEEEIEYQIYEDGSHLQFSINYHRVVIQLITWALILSEKKSDKFNHIVYSRVKLSLSFLANLVNERDGYLPNYGANDGALFFKLNNCNYRDYRAQINALQYAIDRTVSFDNKESIEDIFWYGGKVENKQTIQKLGFNSFPKGGYYTIRDKDSFTFLRCGNHKDRPSQADNLHLDIWVDGENILRDAGSYLYNTDIENIRFFNGTKSHNTIMLGENDQMLKGERFIWYFWTQAISAEILEDETSYNFTGSIKAFLHIDKNIIHTRKVKKYKNKIEWEVIDSVFHSTELPLIQIWNIDETFESNFIITAIDEQKKEIPITYYNGWYSSNYGIKEESRQVIFKKNTKQITTIIKQKIL